ncbi:MAG: DUF4373 domain-containing protein [Patescibacteria group bacterium]|nr:DUF4373 domain-containing protein [Patescibacteria group bacterium]
MKWFKHEDTAGNPKIEMLMDEHGLLGYGFYFRILEMISSNIKENNKKEWGYLPSEYTTEFICRKFKLDEEIYLKLLESCFKLNLFRKINNKIYCEKILERGDDYIGRITKKEINKTTKKLRSNSVLTTHIEEEVEEDINLSKDKLVKTSQRDELVEKVLSLYQKHTGNLPTDKHPRRTAHNIVQITKTLIRDIRPHYPSDRIEELTCQLILEKAFDWYFGQLKDDVEVTKLETVKLNIKARFYEKTRRKYVPDYQLNTSP